MGLGQLPSAKQNQKSAFSLGSGSRQLSMVQAWIEMHREDLRADWELAVDGQIPFPIDPLR